MTERIDASWPAPSPSGGDLWVACLCAGWCGVCAEFGPRLDAVVQALQAQGLSLRTLWLDVEDDEALLHPLDDVDNFPTLLVGRGDQALFFGVVTPIASALERLLRGLADANTPALSQSEVAALAHRLVERLREPGSGR